MRLCRRSVGSRRNGTLVADLSSAAENLVSPTFLRSDDATVFFRWRWLTILWRVRGPGFQTHEAGHREKIVRVFGKPHGSVTLVDECAEDPAFNSVKRNLVRHPRIKCVWPRFFVPSFFDGLLAGLVVRNRIREPGLLLRFEAG